MKTNLLRVVAAAFLMTVASGQLMASNNNNNNDPAEGFEKIQTQAVQIVEQAELTYDQKAKFLGAEMVEGFIATGYKGLTWGLTKLSAFTAGQLYGADTLSEAYLLLGKKEVTGEDADLDLNNLQAVYKFLTETSADKFGKRLDQASGLIGKEGAISYAPMVIKAFLGFYSPKRIGQALDYVYKKNPNNYTLPPLFKEDLEEANNQNINNNNNEEKK